MFSIVLFLDFQWFPCRFFQNRISVRVSVKSGARTVEIVQHPSRPVWMPSRGRQVIGGLTSEGWRASCCGLTLFYVGLIWTYINLSWFIMTPCILCRRSSACSMIWCSLMFNDIMSSKISKSTRVRLSLWVANVAKPWHSGRSEWSLDWPAGRIGMIRARWKSEENSGNVDLWWSM